MPRNVALVGCIVFISYLFWMDLRRPQRSSPALWIPLIWLFLISSRALSSWLGLAPTFADASQYSDGSPIDRLVYLALIAAGTAVLARRSIDWKNLTALNIWIAVYLLYTLSSAAWSDDAFVLFKRWFKDLGTPIMALVILTDPRPTEALATLLRRFTFLTLPLSILFVKYMPELGRTYHWDGAPLYSGIGHQKNHLGTMCLIAGIYIVWDTIRAKPATKLPWWLNPMLMIMVVYLLRLSDSKTSLVCLVVASAILVLNRLFGNRPVQFVGSIFGGTILIGLMEHFFELKNSVLFALGRNPSLTNRTEIWEMTLKYAENPYFGAGYLSFWSGSRMENLWVEVGGKILQAHNGYIEQYLNLGYVGLLFIAAIIATAILKIIVHMSEDRDLGSIRLSLVAVALLYNVTEAAFYGPTSIWLLLMIACLEVPRSRVQTATSTSRQASPPITPFRPAAVLQPLMARTRGSTSAQQMRPLQQLTPSLRRQSSMTDEPHGPLKRRLR